MTLTELYLFLVVLPNAEKTLNGLSVILGFSTIAAFVIAGITAMEGAKDIPKRASKTAIKLFVAAVCVAIVAIPLPSKEQIYTLAGGYVATNAKDVKRLPDNLVAAANSWLEKAAISPDGDAKKSKHD